MGVFPTDREEGVLGGISGEDVGGALSRSETRQPQVNNSVERIWDGAQQQLMQVAV